MTPDGRTVRRLTGADGTLQIWTGVAGPAGAVGHRLTIAMRRWRVITQWDAGGPVDGELDVEVGSLDVVRGEGGLLPLWGLQKSVVRRNALGCLAAKRYARVVFRAVSIKRTDDGYRLDGELTVHGTTRPQRVDVRVDDDGENWRLSSETVVTQSAFGVRPYSQLLGAVKVADDVTVAFTAVAPRAADDRR